MSSSRVVLSLARDSRRAWVSLGLTTAVAMAVSLVLALTTEQVLVGGSLLSQVVGLLLVYAVYFGIYAALTLRVFRGLRGARLRRVLHESTPRDRAARLSRTLSGGGATSWAVSAAATALVVAVLIAFTPSLRESALVLVATGLTVAGAWSQLPLAYAVQYMRDDAVEPGLQFPGGTDFRFSDYLYLAVQVTTTFATSDVAVTSPVMRRRVTAHSLVAFLFSSVIIALVVSALLIAAPTQ